MNSFAKRHIGPSKDDIDHMLKTIGVTSVDELIEKTVPQNIRLNKDLNIDKGITEFEFLNHLKNIGNKNKLYKTYLGLGYYNTIVPSPIQRNILENPAWYTSYTPYQAEISQGRLEALLNFQTVIIELTKMEIANASLLDEASAAAEAMTMLYNARSREMTKNNFNTFIADKNIFPQTLAVLQTRAGLLNINLKIKDFSSENDIDKDAFGIMLQYPNSYGEVTDNSSIIAKAKEKECAVAVSADIMALTILTPPGEQGADVVIGSAQRFGVPMGYGGPHAAFFATCEKYKRFIPGRIIGVSKDREGNRALRMALQTREQHIKRERATSNICTAQALLAIMSGMYAVYHGREGLQEIAFNIHAKATILEQALKHLGYKQLNKQYFDTLKIECPDNLTSEEIVIIAHEHEINIRHLDKKTIGISLDETVTLNDINNIIEIFSIAVIKSAKKITEIPFEVSIKKEWLRNDHYLDFPQFKQYRSETEFMRYIKKLERKDISLVHSMISLGSCTMKLNAATQLFSLSWPEFSNIHPFVPLNQAQGYQFLIHKLGEMLKEITGFTGISFQPNSGATGEYAGLLVIKEYQKSIGQEHRNIVLIPASAHGTNPASAALTGGKVIVVKCDDKGNIDIDDLKTKAYQYKDQLSAFMVTYPSTHGVFEDAIIEMINIVHENGGQVYMDGANMNAQVGLTSPAKIGADVCHLNLHKTFAIPHGGGGPGMGPICVADHLVEFLPVHPIVETGGIKGESVIASAPYGSASILPISYAYCKLLGNEGLTEATKYAILNANYLAKKLEPEFNVLYKGKNGYVGHEMIIDCRNFKKAGVTETDIAKRLMDYGYHAPTLSFPVHGTLMIEPTESESKHELDQFTDALKSIWKEINDIETGKQDKEDNALKFAPHTADYIAQDNWKHTYSRTQAAFPLPYIRENKFWPSVTRLDEAFGDRNLHCSCAPTSDYEME